MRALAHAHKHARTHARTHAHTHTHTHTHIYTHIHTYTHPYTHTQLIHATVLQHVIVACAVASHYVVPKFNSSIWILSAWSLRWLATASIFDTPFRTCIKCALFACVVLRGEQLPQYCFTVSDARLVSTSFDPTHRSCLETRPTAHFPALSVRMSIA